MSGRGGERQPAATRYQQRCGERNDSNFGGKECRAHFVAAGGLLMAGLDPTGNGGVVAGFGDLREVELLVEAGFTPLEAIKIASLNGAKFLGEDARIGSIAVGKQADLMIVKGNPAAKISDIENVEIVFKDGVGYDSEKLIQSVQGLVGIREQASNQTAG